MNIFTEFEKKLKKALESANLKTKDNQKLDLSRVIVETPRDPAHGDLATNAALVLAQSVDQNPRQLAGVIQDFFAKDPDILSTEIAGPAFINFRLKQEYWHDLLVKIYHNKENYGRSLNGQGHRVNVEYVSANPTGPLHVGHCRGAVVGDVIANLLKFRGHDVVKEYYINDAGNQINVLAQSVFLRYQEALGVNIGAIPEGLYPGTYLIPIGEKLAKLYGNCYLDKENEALPIFKDFAIKEMLNLIREDLVALKIKQDVFFSEKSLHDHEQKAIKDTIEVLKEKNYIYKGKLPPPKGQVSEDWEDREQLLFKTTLHGDDQDRALAKSDNSFTYFAADIAYFYDKYKRNFDEMVYILGADHSGYVKRLEATAAALSDKKARLTAILCQMVRLYRDNVPVKMSKRAGSFITLREVVDEVGADPIRFMMLSRKADGIIDFDMAKVKEQSKDNPVFYVQYAYARAHSIFRQAKTAFNEDLHLNYKCSDYFSLLKNESELTLIKKLAEYPKLIELAAYHREPHRLAFYLYDLASLFHAQWNKGNEDKTLRFVLADQKELTLARIGLVQSIAAVLKSGLDLIGVEAPEHMY